MLRRFIAAACLVLATAASATTATAQVGDFTGQIQPILPANELLVGLIREAMPSGDLDGMFQQTEQTLGLGEDLVQGLDQAMILAPDDAARSRIEGILAHTQAAVASLRQAQLEETLDSARGRLEQARGEAQEGLDELRPFIMDLIASGAIVGK